MTSTTPPLRIELPPHPFASYAYTEAWNRPASVTLRERPADVATLYEIVGTQLLALQPGYSMHARDRVPIPPSLFRVETDDGRVLLPRRTRADAIPADVYTVVVVASPEYTRLEQENELVRRNHNAIGSNRFPVRAGGAGIIARLRADFDLVRHDWETYDRAHIREWRPVLTREGRI